MHGPRSLVLSVAATTYRIGLTIAYIPAVPINDTTVLVSQSQDFIQLQWQALGSSTGFFRDSLSRQLVADNSTQTGVNYAARGALVHFTEANATAPPSAAPWIALINCDSNGTVFSQVDDIFTLSRDRGAIAAVLYSKTGQACRINNHYLSNFEKPIDVYSALSSSSAQLIDSQFSNVGSAAKWFDSALLNASAPLIWQALNNTDVVLPASTTATPSSPSSSSSSSSSLAASSISSDDGSGDYGSAYSAASGASFARRQATVSATQTSRVAPSVTTSTIIPVAAPSAQIAVASGVSYLIAVVANVNAQFIAPSATATAAAGGTSSGPSTGLAMIILYAITGVVTVLFLVVVLTGAVRAIRHPERYGPRRLPGNGGYGDEGYVGYQSRASGLTRAILDTMSPIVKFGSTRNAPSAPAHVRRHSTQKLNDVEMGGVKDLHYAGNTDESNDVLPHLGLHDRRESTGSSAAAADAPAVGVDPALVDDSQSCPICVEAFEDGDDIRVLPCDERHRFHADCVDPWLLKVSALCPLCRSDVRGANAPTSGDDEEEDDVEPISEPLPAPVPASRSRFARYVTSVRVARRRNSVSTVGSSRHPPPFASALSHASPALP